MCELRKFNAMKLQLYFHLALFFLCSPAIFGQNVWVKVVGSQTGEVLPFANVVSDSSQGITDENGLIRLSTLQSYEISYLGYETTTVKPSFSEDTLYLHLNIKNTLLDVAVVSGNRSGERYMNAIAPLDILPQSLLSSRSTPELSSVINNMPGVQIIDGQISIRGGAGYAYGAGSRVALLLNGIPMLQADAASVPWNDLPIELLERTEILKSSAATLYGSAALNGLIQLHTWPYVGDTSFTKVLLACRWIDGLRDKEKQWYGDTRPSYWGHLVHKELEGAFQWQGSLRYEDLQTHLKGNQSSRFRLSFLSKYQLDARWEIGLQSLFNRSVEDAFLYWKNNSDAALIGAEGAEVNNDVSRIQFDPYLKYTSRSGNRHWLQFRLFYGENNATDNRASSVKQYLMQYQYAHNLWEGKGLWLNGLTSQAFNSNAELFGNRDLWAYNAAAYTKYEHTFFRKLKVTAGFRMEYNGQFPGQVIVGTDSIQADTEEFKPLFSSGMNYEITRSTAISFHFGQGYRFPSIAEKFTATSLGLINISPSPQLVSEDGYSMNLSVKQGLIWGGIQSLLRLDLFQMQYNDMIEFGLRDPNLGFQALNIGDTDIRGLELSWMGEAQWSDWRWEYLWAYTHILPKYRMFTEDIAARSSVDYNILKYRVREQFTFQNQLFWRQWQIGISALYNSEMEAIDSVLELFVVNGLAEYRNENSSAFLKWDLSIGYRFKKFRLLFDIQNLGNVEYSLRPALLAMPRNFNLQFEFSF